MIYQLSICKEDGTTPLGKCPTVYIEADDRGGMLNTFFTEYAGYEIVSWGVKDEIEAWEAKRKELRTVAEMKELAAAAGKQGEHFYNHPRDSNLHKENDAWLRAARPELFLELARRLERAELALARGRFADYGDEGWKPLEPQK